MIARITRYRTPPAAVSWLVNEIVALARSRSHEFVRNPDRTAEFFFVHTPTGDGLSVVLGTSRAVMPAIDIEGADRGDPQEYDVQLLQLGGPRDSGVVPALYAKVVRGRPDAAHEALDRDAVPSSPHVWVRALLRANGGDVLAFAVGTEWAAIAESLQKLGAPAAEVESFDDVAYHFWRDRS